jgi:hypothetical protein
VIALLATVGSVAAGLRTKYRIRLTGAEAGVETRASGKATFRLDKDGDEMRFKLVVKKIENLTMAHIHVSDVPGGNGPPVVWLYPEGPPPDEIPGRFSSRLAKGFFTADDFVNTLAGMEFEALLTAIEEGRTYVNVHTTQNPGGEIRGQIH